MAKRNEQQQKLDRLFELLDRLEGDGTVVTSVRQPVALREAVKVAVSLGLDPTPNDAAVAALRDRLESFAQRLALDAHYKPDAPGPGPAWRIGHWPQRGSTTTRWPTNRHCSPGPRTPWPVYGRVPQPTTSCSTPRLWPRRGAHDPHAARGAEAPRAAPRNRDRRQRGGRRPG